jgi:four helix bundle protein
MAKFRMKNEIKARLKTPAHECVRVTSGLEDSKLTRVISYQLIKSSTSSAANYHAACLAQSAPQLKAKLSMVIEKLEESVFWLDFLKDESLIDPYKTKELTEEANSILTILISSRMTLQNKR